MAGAGTGTVEVYYRAKARGERDEDSSGNGRSNNMYLRCHTQQEGGEETAARPALGTVGTSVVQQGSLSSRMLQFIRPKCKPRGMKTGLHMPFKCAHQKTVSAESDQAERRLVTSGLCGLRGCATYLVAFVFQ